MFENGKLLPPLTEAAICGQSALLAACRRLGSQPLRRQRQARFWHKQAAYIRMLYIPSQIAMIDQKKKRTNTTK